MTELPKSGLAAPAKDAVRSLQRLTPGALTSLTIAMASAFVSEHYGGPTLLFALLIGMALHFLSKETAAAEGIAFSARTILRIGVALLGARVSAGQIAELGMEPIIVVVVGVIATLLFGRFLARPLGLTSSQGVLTAGSVAICGASAALAISAVLPQNKNTERDTLFTVAAVTTLSTIAMILYPLLVKALGLDDRAAGILLGGAIHDVAQVVGAGHLISEEVGAVATYVKLLRVAMLIPVVMAIAWFFRGEAVSGSRPKLPGFLIVFALLAIANSFGLIPAAISDVAGDVSRWCLICAIAALGMKTSLEELAKIGWRPMAIAIAETLFLLALVVAVLTWI